MKKHAYLFFFIGLLFFNANAFAQDFELPQDYEFTKKEDYAQYHRQIIEAAGWLETTPLNKEVEKRQQINAFMFQWISGSPDVSVELQQYVSTFSEKNPQLLIVFLAGWARHQLQHPEEQDKLKFHAAGVVAVLRAYEIGGAGKDKGIEKLLKIREKGKLEKWIDKKVS